MKNKEDMPEVKVDDLPEQIEIDEKIDVALGELIPADDTRAQVVSLVTTVIKSEIRVHSGPLPPPEQLAEYDIIHPGFALRIFEMAEKQQQHGIDMAQKISDSDIEHRNTITESEIIDRKRGMYLGAALFLLLMIFALILGLNDKPVVAGFFLAAAAVNAVSLFINGRNHNGNNDSE